MRRVWLLAVAALALLAVLNGTAAAEQTREEALGWFKRARFGMFIHWGIYSLLGRGEWVMHNEKIPVEEYEKLQQRFNPTRFNADKWVALAKRAGMRYITFTSKHHDGFCMFNSKLTRYSSWYAPCHRDFVKELTDACHRAGLKIFYYYSLLDWHHPDYKRNIRKYVDEYAFGQIRELCTNYGRIAGIWFDGGWEHPPEVWRSEELIAMIRRLQPWALVNNRARWDGDFITPEQRIPPMRVGPKDTPFECCFTINRSWGYNARDRNFKSAVQLIRMLATIVGRGGNLLLNVGPLPTGEIPEEQAARLRQMGEWLAKYGESIYGCFAGPFPETPWGACTAKGNRLYIHMFEWPGRELLLPGLKTRVRRAWVMKGRARVEFRHEEEGVRLRLPEIAPDLADTVVVLELAGEPEVELAIRPDERGVIRLPADRAIIHGQAQVEAYPRHGPNRVSNIGYWTRKEDWVEWEIVVPKAGTYEVWVWSANPPASGGQARIEIGPQAISWRPEATGSWEEFKWFRVGTVELKPGRYKVAVKPVELKGALTNLRAIELRPLQ